MGSQSRRSQIRRRPGITEAIRLAPILFQFFGKIETLRWVIAM